MKTQETQISQERQECASQDPEQQRADSCAAAGPITNIHSDTNGMYSHLDPSIRPIATQDDFARAQHVLKDVYLHHPYAQQVERQVEQLIRFPRKFRMPGMFLCAESGMGKTQILRRIERRHPPYEWVVAIVHRLHHDETSRGGGGGDSLGLANVGRERLLA